MTDWLKLAQCKHTPSQLYTIFDYTKIAYPIDSYFCLRQIFTPEQKPNFIEIQHNFDEIISMHGAQNYIITVERKDQTYFIYFYAISFNEQCIRITWNLQGEHLKVKSIYNDNILILCCTSVDQNNHQIIFFDCSEKCIIARGFVQGEIQDICIGPNNSISIQYPKHIVAYKNQPRLEAMTVTRIYKQAEAQISSQIQHHLWIEDQLFVWGKNKAYIIIKNKICQQFDHFHRLHNLVALTCGFLACDGCVVKIFKKNNIKYEMICEFVDEQLMQCKNMSLSPQQDILAYYNPVNNAIIYSSTFSAQIQQSQSNQNAINLSYNLQVKSISHIKAYDYSIYSSSQAWFAAVNGYEIQLINSHNYQQFLSIQLKDKDQTTFLNSDLKIRHLAIHPSRPIFAVALKKVIRLYYVTFNQAKILKQINFSMCGLILFNNSGSLMTAVVSGKGGAKLYIFQINQLKGQYVLIQTLTIAKKPISLAWDNLDSKLLCFFSQGYYEWTVQSKFKNRKQILLKFKFEVKGAKIAKQDLIIFWGGNKLASVLNQQIVQQQTIKGLQIKQIFLEGDYYYFAFQNGKVSRYKTLEVEASLIKSIDLNTKQKKYEIQIQQGRKYIYISEDLNIKYYEFGASMSTFTDIVGIQKKKLYGIMQKHKQYQNQIRRIREQFANVVVEIKNKAILEQQKKEEEYKRELSDHIQREKKVKQQKTKLQEMMEQNIEVKQRESMNQIKELQKLYQRKIALTTNKLLTEKQIGFRQKITSQNRLKVLEERHYNSIEQIRKQFAQHLKSNILDKNEAQREVNNLKKQYEARLYQLQEQNQILLKGLQEKNESSIIGLKKMVNNWENKYSQCISMKDNLERQLRQQQLSNQLLKQKISYIQTRKMESQRRCEHLSNEVTKVQRVLQERNRKLQHYEKRIQDLQKSNQILKYRVLEVKEQNDPYEQQIAKLKANLTDLEEEYDKILKHSHQQDQKILIIKKEKIKLKEDNQVINQKYKKLSKRHEELLDKIRETTKSPIQQIRKQLLAIVDSYVKIQKSYSVLNKRADSPLGELNRIRDHLEVCLDQAMTSNKKNDEQRKIQIVKKSQQNSQLIIEINTMRKKIRILEDQIRQKNVQIGRLMRGETPPSLMTKQQKMSTTQAQSKQFTKTKSRETFFEKSLFKSGSHWNRKRLKTQQGERRKKSSHSMMRDRNPNGSLHIHPQAEQIQQYKRIIQQKDIFIQKLIAKIQKNG